MSKPDVIGDPQNGATLDEAEALVSMLLIADPLGFGPKKPRGVLNVLVLALAVLEFDHGDGLPPLTPLAVMHALDFNRGYVLRARASEATTP